MDLASLTAQRNSLWNEKAGWNTLYADAFKYAIPNRRSVSAQGGTQAKSTVGEIYDITAPIATMRFAGQLQTDMFPPGQQWFTLAPGAIAEKAFRARGEGETDLLTFRREIEALADEMHPHFHTGEFDAAVSEMCSDLAAGTGCMLPLRAGKDDTEFVRFAAVPFEEYALAPGGYGDVGGLFWKTRQPASAIKAQWASGVYPESFTKALADKPFEPVEINQDFVRDGKGWKLVVTLTDSDVPVATESYRTRPFISPRYFKVPGEGYGRGPLLMSLGAIKTLNRTVELTLKASALQMLGIWGYRPSSALNPDTMAHVPGAFWPMQSTGGVMGPDVFRLDAGSRDIQVGSITQDTLRAQIRAALMDDSLPDGGATPKSATEIMARAARIKTNYLGAFGRLLHETTPLVPRVYEILRDARVVSSQIHIDQFLTKVSVTSPLAQALRTDAVKSVFEYVQVVAQLKGPQAVDRHVHLDSMLADVGVDMGIAAKYIKTERERAQYDEQAAQQAAAASVAEAAANDPKGMMEAAQMAEGASGRPNLQLVS